MLREITLSVPEDIYLQVQQVATEAKCNIAKVLLDTISSKFLPRPVNPKRALMRKEIAAYQKIHPHLVTEYLDQYVAIHRGKLVDYYQDPVALHKRIVMKYPEQIVLSRKVQNNPEPVLHMRSPRLERSL